MTPIREVQYTGFADRPELRRDAESAQRVLEHELRNSDGPLSVTWALLPGETQVELSITDPELNTLIDSLIDSKEQAEQDDPELGEMREQLRQRRPGYDTVTERLPASELRTERDLRIRVRRLHDELLKRKAELLMVAWGMQILAGSHSEQG